MLWNGDMNWTHIISIIALVVATAILGVSVYYNRKSIATSTKILNLSKQHTREISYSDMRNVVEKSDKGYDAFSNLRMLFESYQGVWVDDEIKKFVDGKSKEIEEFEKESPFRMQEPEQRNYTDGEIEKINMEDQKYIESLPLEMRYEYEFDQRFGNVKEELLKLIDGNLKNLTKKINEK